ncbi:MAG: hypothetical protein NVSMB29_11310 [Candidatus Dormibacteria bacterium]
MGAHRRIGEVAKLVGVSVPTIRYYEEEGLVHPWGRTEAGYRLYDDEAVARLRFIGRAKALGLRLTKIAEILRSPDAASEREALRHAIAHRLAEVHRQVGELQSLEHSLERRYLQVTRDRCDCRHLGDCACAPLHPTAVEVSWMAQETVTASVGECACTCAPQ